MVRGEVPFFVGAHLDGQATFRADDDTAAVVQPALKPGSEHIDRLLLRHIREGVPHIPVLDTINVHADHRAVCGVCIHIHPGVIGNAPRRREGVAPFLLGDPFRIRHDLLNEGGAV